MTTEPISETETRNRGRWHALRPRKPHPVWWLNLAVLAAAYALYAGPVHGLPPLMRPHMQWWLVAMAFAVAERGVVHLHFRRGAHSFSLADIPLVFALIFCSAEAVVFGCLIGSTAMLLLDRRLPLIKLVFNVAQLTLATLITELVVLVEPGHHAGRLLQARRVRARRAHRLAAGAQQHLRQRLLGLHR